MSLAERVQWDNHYLSLKGTRDFPAPDPLLFEYVPPLFEPRVYRALDVGCGMGQNGIWMASQGYRTDAIDISRVGLSVGQVQAAKQGIKNINLLPQDLDEVTLQRDTYDVVAVIRFIKRGLMPEIRACVRPGGRVIYQAYNTLHLHTDPDHDPDQLFRMGELVGYFADWRIIHSTNIKGISQLVAVKPE